MGQDSRNFVNKINDCSKDELYLITPKYLKPYLSYIKRNKRLFLTAIKKAKVLQLNQSYSQLFQHVLMPILDCYQVPQEERKYIMSFYIQGIIAIITQWLKDDCKEGNRICDASDSTMYQTTKREFMKAGIYLGKEKVKIQELPLLKWVIMMF